jgi:tetratricopeptide (TPR) repeat protein
VPTIRDMMPEWQKHSNAAIFHEHQGNIELAIEEKRRCIDILRRLPALIREMAISLNYLAHLYLCQGDTDHAETAIREAIDINRSIDSVNLHCDLLILAEILWQYGRCGEALQAAEESLTVSERLGHAHGIGLATDVIKKIKGIRAVR